VFSPAGIVAVAFGFPLAPMLDRLALEAAPNLQTVSSGHFGSEGAFAFLARKSA
jgi:hypothetical protein